MASPFIQEKPQSNALSARTRCGESRRIALSLRLKQETAPLHAEAERSLGLPEKLATLQAYRGCLSTFYLLYQPLEASMAHFVEWSRLGLDMPERAFTPRLRSDLLALGLHGAEWSPGQSPAHAMPSFAQALGARYVLEGSTLGSKHILRHVRAVLGTKIDGADAFFRGHESKTGPIWKAFRIALDVYGTRFPEHADQVIAGATATFQSIVRGIQQ